MAEVVLRNRPGPEIGDRRSNRTFFPFDNAVFALDHSGEGYPYALHLSIVGSGRAQPGYGMVKIFTTFVLRRGALHERMMFPSRAQPSCGKVEIVISSVPRRALESECILRIIHRQDFIADLLADETEGRLMGAPELCLLIDEACRDHGAVFDHGIAVNRVTKLPW